MTCQNPRRLEGSLLWRLSRLTARKSLSPCLKGDSVSPLQGKGQPQCSRACCFPALPPCHWVPCVGTADQPPGVSLVGPLTLWPFRLLSLLLLPYGLHTLRLSGRPVLESFPSLAFPLSWQHPVQRSSSPIARLVWTLASCSQHHISRFVVSSFRWLLLSLWSAKRPSSFWYELHLSHISPVLSWCNWLPNR